MDGKVWRIRNLLRLQSGFFQRVKKLMDLGDLSSGSWHRACHLYLPSSLPLVGMERCVEHAFTHVGNVTYNCIHYAAVAAAKSLQSCPTLCDKSFSHLLFTTTPSGGPGINFRENGVQKQEF